MSESQSEHTYAHFEPTNQPQTPKVLHGVCLHSAQRLLRVAEATTAYLQRRFHPKEFTTELLILDKHQGHSLNAHGARSAALFKARSAALFKEEHDLRRSKRFASILDDLLPLLQRGDAGRRHRDELRCKSIVFIVFA